jgi:RNA polymerase sigma-70 factor (ECF subfamily)
MWPFSTVTEPKRRSSPLASSPVWRTKAGRVSSALIDAIDSASLPADANAAASHQFHFDLHGTPGRLARYGGRQDAAWAWCYGSHMADGPGHDALARDALVHVNALHRLARYLTRGNADAEDLVQETYARAFGAAARFAPGTNVKAWLFRILRNTFISEYRRRRASPLVAGLTLTESAEAHAENFLRDDLELDRLRKVVGEEIEAALMTLGEEARTVVLLDLEDLSEAEIAAVLDCPVGTVKSRLSRARAALRQRLRDYAR